MKKLFPSILLLLLICTGAYAQRCGTGTAAVISHGASGTPGFLPTADNMPCIVSGSQVSDTLFFENFSSFSGLIVNYLKFDSIYLPQGLCWETNAVNDTFGGGRTGAIYISGQCTAPAGQYALRMIIDANAGPGGAVNLTSQDAFALAHLQLYLRVLSPSDSVCHAIDYLDSTLAYIPYDGNFPPYAHGAGSPATISPAGPITICAGDSVVLSVPDIPGNIYQWCNGAQTASTVVRIPYNYTVTVTTTNTVLVSAPVQVTVDTVFASYILIQDTTPHTWTVYDSIFSTDGAPIIDETWTWGDSTTTAGFAPTHTYSAAGYYTIGVEVTDGNGCRAHYNDTSTYMFKTDAQIVGVKVIPRIATGISPITDVAALRAYPNPTSGFMTIESPAAQSQEAVIYDAHGSKVRELTIHTGHSTLDVRSLPDGVYDLIAGGSNTSIIRFIVAR